MSNHICNQLTVEASPEQVAAILESIRGEECVAIDFNKIVPMPNALRNVGSGSKDFDGVRVNRWWTDNSVEWNDPARKPDRLLAPDEEAALDATGYTDWYVWSIANWSTKWNAYHQAIESDNAISFQTAWSAPLPVIDSLAARFPAARFRLEYADEDRGSNAGIVEYEHGERSAETSLGHRRACALWFDLNGADPKDYGYDPVTFEYVGDDEEAA